MLDPYFKIMRWAFTIGGNLFGGAGMVFWFLGFYHPEAAAYAIVCLLIATMSEHARRVTRE